VDHAAGNGHLECLRWLHRAARAYVLLAVSAETDVSLFCFGIQSMATACVGSCGSCRPLAGAGVYVRLGNGTIHMSACWDLSLSLFSAILLSFYMQEESTTTAPRTPSPAIVLSRTPSTTSLLAAASAASLDSSSTSSPTSSRRLVASGSPSNRLAPWLQPDSRVCAAAAEGGHLQVLKVARL
jgi:hypothetical protein